MGGDNMEKMTKKEILEFGKDLLKAKIRIFNKHGYSAKEISEAFGISESIVRSIINTND